MSVSTSTSFTCVQAPPWYIQVQTVLGLPGPQVEVTGAGLQLFENGDLLALAGIVVDPVLHHEGAGVVAAGNDEFPQRTIFEDFHVSHPGLPGDTRSFDRAGGGHCAKGAKML